MAYTYLVTLLSTIFKPNINDLALVLSYGLHFKLYFNS